MCSTLVQLSVIGMTLLWYDLARNWVQADSFGGMCSTNCTT